MYALLLFTIVGVSACSLVPGVSPTSEGKRVTVTTTDDALVVANRTNEPIWTFVAGQQALTTMLWAPTIDGDGIPPEGTKSIPISEIPKGPDEQEVIVYWWHAMTQDGERVPGEIQSIVVDL